jgi:uncharacterized SAM-binding protein YcdF (DUF218 family)
MGATMLYVARILPAVFLPCGLAIILLIASLALRKRALTVIALVVLWLSSTSLFGDAIMRAAEGWQVRQPVSAAPNADAVVVLSGMLVEVPGPVPSEEWSDGVDRFDAGVDLVKSGKAPVLVFTGGWLPWHLDARPEGDVLTERAVALGVPRDRILVTGKVRNTAEEAQAVAQLLRNRGQGAGTRSIALVTSAYHMRRSRLLFTRAGLLVSPFPVDFQTSASPLSFMDLLPHAGSLENTEVAVREFYGYLYYRWIKRS